MKSISISSSDSDPNSKFSSQFVDSIGSHWTKSGLLNSRIDFSRILTISSLILMTAKSAYGLRCGWHCRRYQMYFGDFFSVFGSQPIWLYLNLTVTVTPLVGLITPLLTRRFFSQEWFGIFSCLSGQMSLTNLRLSEVSISKLLYFAKVINLFINFTTYVPHLASAGFALLYFFKFQTVESFFLSLFWGLHFFVQARAVGAAVMIPPQYLALFCYYVNLRSRELSKKISDLIPKKSISKGKELFQRKLVSSEIESIISDQQHMFKQIRDCNRLYRHLAATIIPPMTGGALGMIYALQKSEGFVEKVFLLYFVVVATLLVAAFFAAGEIVSRAVKKLYRNWNNANVQTTFFSKTRISFRARWHLLLTLEFLASKRYRVGLKCLHWFVLKSFTFMKVNIKS